MFYGVNQPSDSRLKGQKRAEELVKTATGPAYQVKYTHFKFGVVYDLNQFFIMMKRMPFHAREFYVVADSYCNKYPWLDLDLKASHFATLPSLNEVEVIDELIELWVAGFSELTGKHFTKDDVCVHTCFRNDKRSYHLILKSVKDNVATVFSSMAQEKIFVTALHRVLRELPGDVGAFWRLAQEPDLSVYKSSQAFRLLGCSKNDSPPFRLRFAPDPNYDPTLEEMVEAFPLVLHGTKTTFVLDLKSRTINLDVFARKTSSSQSSLAMIPPIISQGPPTPLPLGHSQEQAHLDDDLAWLANISDQFDSRPESSTGSAVRQLAHGVTQGHQVLSSGSQLEARISPVVLTPSRALHMQQLSLQSPQSRGLRRPLEMVSPSPIRRKHNAFVPLPEDVKHLLRQLWSLHPRHYDVQCYMEKSKLTQAFRKVLRYTPESKTFLVTFGPHPASPCGKIHKSNGSYLVWKDIPNLLTPVSVRVGENSSHTSHVPGFGKLIHYCHDEMCSGKVVEVPYYGDKISYDCPTNIMLPDWVYTLCECSPAVACDFLIQRLFGRTSSLQKVYFIAGDFLAWNGIFWATLMNPSERLRMVVVKYIKQISKQLGQDWSSGAPSLQLDQQKEVQVWVERIRKALSVLALNCQDHKLFTVEHLATLLRPSVSQFDSSAARNVVVVGERCICLKTGKFLAPSPSHFVSRRIPTGWLGKEIPPQVFFDAPPADKFPLVFQYLKTIFSEHQGEEGQVFFTFLQTLFGYCLTGLNSHHYLVFLVGKGGNGKSMFTSMLRSVLNGDDKDLSSASVAAPSSFPPQPKYSGGDFEACQKGLVQSLGKHAVLQSSSNSSNAHTAQLNNLVGTRIALIDELNSEDFLDKSLIKRLTGGDPLVLRFPYDKHEFVVTHPCHSIIVTCNSLPYMVPDPSVTRRFIIIRFNTTFASKSSLDAEQKAVEKAGSLSRKIAFYGSRRQTAVQDPQAIYKLVKQREFKEQVLAWLIQGAMKFNQQGLIFPECVADSREQYWMENDIVASFLDNHSERMPTDDPSLPMDIDLAIRNGYYTSYDRLLTRFKSWLTQQDFKVHLKNEARDNFKGHLERFRLPALKLRDVNGGQRVVIGIKYSSVAPTFSLPHIL